MHLILFAAVWLVYASAIALVALGTPAGLNVLAATVTAIALLGPAISMTAAINDWRSR